MEEINLQPYLVRESEWLTIARAMELEFPERRWADGNKLTAVSPWGRSPVKAGGALTDVIVLSEQNGKIHYHWVPNSAPPVTDASPLVSVERFRIKDKIREIDF
jgi:hypothetical protein